jgi:SAM-dependent methyltransferase
MMGRPKLDPVSYSPAYVALERWLLAKRVAVLSPVGPEGPRRLAAAGAGLVLVVGGNCPPAPGVEVWAGDPSFPLPLPLRPASVDAVLCIEAYEALTPERRAGLIQDASRVLRPGGVLAVWGEDLATHERELRAGFPEVVALAQMRWTGLSLAPVGDVPAAGVRLVEDLLPRSPSAGPFLILGATSDLGALVTECLIVPLDASLAPDAPSIGEIAASPVTAPPTADDEGDLLDALFDAPASSAPSSSVVAPPLLQTGPNAELAVLRQKLAAVTSERDGLVAELADARMSRREADAPIPRSSESSLSMLVGHVVDEPPRPTADAAFDRDRLREELSRRTADIQALETKLWQAEEDAQRENLENVRLVTDVDRLREQVERSRGVEQERVQELERLGHELRKLEVAHAELQGLHQTREQRLRELEATVQGDQGPPELATLQDEIRELGAQRDQAQALERAAAELARRRERELAEAGRTIRELRRTLEEHAGIAANLRGELAVIQVRVEQFSATVPKLQERLRDQQKRSADRDMETSDLQRRLEEAVAEQQHLRSKLRVMRQELDNLAAERVVLEAEQQRVREELEAKRQAVEQLQQIVALGGAKSGPGNAEETAALRALLAQQAADHAAVLARSEEQQRVAAEAERERLGRLQLEVWVRGDEQEYLLYQLDTAEQRIWEMNDATDRSAARLAAGLAQLDKQKEQYEDLIDQLEVSRNLLAEAQAHVVELERQLASERTRVARLSLDVGGGRVEIDVEDEEGAEPGTFDVLVEDRDELAPRLRRDPTRPDPLAGIDFDDDDDSGPSLAARLAFGTHDDGDDLTPGVHIDVDDDDHGRSLPDMRLQIDVDDDDDDDDITTPPPLPAAPRSLRTAFIDDEDEDLFTIDTDQIELATPTPPPPTPDRPGFDQKLTDHSNARIVIEVLEDEAWPEDEPQGGEDPHSGGS